MKRTTEEKAITLVALIITIIVLLTLAMVTIAAVRGDGIIAHAENAVNTYEQKVSEENTILGNYLQMIQNNIPGGGSVPRVAVETIATENSTINGQAYSSTNPVIPKGFMAINTDTSSWDAANGPEVTKGLVIDDGTGNQFVWIPVANINDMVKPAAAGGVDKNGRTNYQGRLYNFFGTGDNITATEMTNYGQE